MFTKSKKLTSDRTSSSFASPSPSLTSSARTSHRVRVADVSKVLCHRLRNGKEQYLIRWKTDKDPLVHPRAICSWHSLNELSLCLHHVQTYIETRKTLPAAATNGNGFAAIPGSRKRKSPDSDQSTSRDSSNGITPRDSAYLSREQSVISDGSSSAVSDVAMTQPPEVYNGVLQRKEGKIMAKKSRDSTVVEVNAQKLPDQQMLDAATHAPIAIAEQMIRIAFESKLQRVHHTRWENNVDNSAPSLDFTFVKEFVLGDGVYRPDPGAHVGCEMPCKPNMGQGIGCEYPRLCTCLEFAAVNEKELLRENPKRYAQYLQEKEAAEQDGSSLEIDTRELPKRFPYTKPNVDARIPSTLQNFYMEQRYPIYECNLNCNCGPVCKSRVVQKCRRVPLVIFKTDNNRGWGVYCDEDLIKGEFIDTYIGEVITNEEADRREARAGKDKHSYLYNLDKFVGDDPTLTDDTCYVVDGQYMGGPTRFVNHSCEPNCRQYTVSYNKHDLRIYDLAFFAIEDIPAGTELTFDYMDKDEQEEEDVLRARAEAAEDPENFDKVPCNCGARKCRGYMWV